MRRNRFYIIAICMVFVFLGAGRALADRKISIVKDLNHNNNGIGTFRALIIGIQDYDDINIPDLETPLNDARAMATVLKDKYGFEIKLLLDKKATKKAIYNALRTITGSAKPADSILIYYAGHGEIDRTFNDGWWIPVDARGGEPFTYLDNGQIQKAMASMKARHVLLISDSCYSGTLFGNARAIPKVIGDKYYLNLYNEKSRWGMTSGNKTPVSDSGSQGHSVFAYQLIKKLKNSVQPYISTQELYTDIAPIVANNSEQQPLCRPIKNTGDMGGEFIFIAAIPETTKGASNTVTPQPGVLPKNSATSFDDILNASKQKKKEEQQWQTWQTAREKEFAQAKMIDNDRYLTRDQKAEAWRRMQATLSEDNPFSTKDEQMRTYAGQRVANWEKPPPKQPETAKLASIKPNKKSTKWVQVVGGKTYSWKMALLFPKRLPVFGAHFERFAKIVKQKSNGRLKIKVYGPGEIVKSMDTFKAVSQGTVQAGGSVSYYWAKKIPAANWFATIPFGMNARGMQTWLHNQGGLALWEEVYAPYNVIPRPGGVIETAMGGWYNKEIRSIQDFKGLKMRMPGLGAKVIKRAGGIPVLLPAGEIIPALKRGVIDASEWMGPFHDMKMGLHNAGKYYYYPGWHEPGTNLEFIFNKDAYGKLPYELQQLIDMAAKDCENWLMNQMAEKNGAAFEELVTRHGVTIKRFPQQVLDQLKAYSDEVLKKTAASDPVATKVYNVYQAVQKRLGPEASSLFQARYMQ